MRRSYVFNVIHYSSYIIIIHFSQLAVLLLVLMVAHVSDLGNVIALRSGRVMIAKMV